MPVSMSDVRAPVVNFERRAVQNPLKSEQAGQYVAEDVDFIEIIPHGSEGKTVLNERYDDWLGKHKSQRSHAYRAPGAQSDVPNMMDSRFPAEWLERIEKAYAAWRKGEELPLEGTPLKQWSVITPATLQNCIVNHILTIEQLAGASDEALNPIGMGARTLREQAINWLKLNDKSEKNKMVTQLAQLGQDIATLTTQMTELMARNKSLAEDNQRLRDNLIAVGKQTMAGAA